MSEPNVNALNSPARSRVSTKTIASLAMLTGIAYVIMVVSKALPQVSGFLQFDFKDTVICIGGFIFGPMAAAMVSIVVALIEMVTVSDTGLIGLIMNILATCGFCCTASFVYKRQHTKQGAVLGLALGTLVLTAIMLLWNYLITPIYMGMPRQAVADMLLPVFLPFNLVKGGMNMAAILLLYKPVVSALRRSHLIADSQSTETKRFSAGFLLFSLALLATFGTLGLVLMNVI